MASVNLQKLEDIQQKFEITDFDYNFEYQRIFDPKGNPTNHFIVFFKNNVDSEWSIKNGLLSNKFTVVKTEDVMKKIQEDFSFDQNNFQYYQSGCSIKCDFVTNYRLSEDICGITEADKILFSLITGISVEQVSTNWGLSFELVNGMGGNHSLQLSYGLFQKLSGNNKNLNTNNLFILDEFRRKLIHNASMFVGFEEVEKVKQNVGNSITKLTNIKVTPNFIEDMKRVLHRGLHKRFVEIFNEVPKEQQNLFYATQVLTHILAQQQDLALELRARNAVSRWVKAHEQQKST